MLSCCLLRGGAVEKRVAAGFHEHVFVFTRRYNAVSGHWKKQALVVDALADKRLYEQELARTREENKFLQDQVNGRFLVNALMTFFWGGGSVHALIT